MPADLTLEVIGGAITAFLAVLLRMAVRFALSPEGRVILRVLREAGVKAAVRARDAFKAGLARAHAQDSDGGADVTDKERQALARDTAQAFLRELDVLGVLERVAEKLGGVSKLEDALANRVDAELARLAGKKK